MFRNRIFKVLSNLILMAVLCTGQVSAAPNNSADEIKRNSSTIPVNANLPLASESAPQAVMSPGDTIRVSVNSAGAQGNDVSYSPSISTDGRYVAFTSNASNLVSGDTNEAVDIFVRDTQTNTTTRASVNSAGEQGNNGSSSPSISADGRYVAFMSNASNLVSGDNNAVYNDDVFVRDTQTNTTTLVSVSSAGEQGNDASYFPSISADGRYVAFYSSASNLVSGDDNSTSDVFVRDTQTNTTTRVSVNSAGEQGNDASSSPSISADGRYVAFYSSASNLVSGDDNSTSDVFVRDTQTNTTTLVSVNSAGEQGNGMVQNSSISADGRYVAFDSNSSNLISGETNGTWDVFVRDTQTNTTTRVPVNSTGEQGNDESSHPSISADGRYVAFYSSASNLVSGDDNNTYDVFVRDTQTNTTTRVSVSSADEQGNNGSYFPSISADGRYLAFDSDASNLVSGDNNAYYDVFVHRMEDKDSDGDGLLNTWETQGLTVNVNGQDVFLNLPLMGADPNRKDIFVEIDYMVDTGICTPLGGCQSGHSHQPKPESITKIVQAFANAPVSNPDGSTGINLHVDYGINSEMNPITHATWGALSRSNNLAHDDSLGWKNSNGTYSWTDFDLIKNSNFSQARAAVFHYSVFAHNLGGLGTISGMSRDINASDFIVSLGSWSGSVGSTNEQAGTFMHELGHNLGLRHGGNDHVRFKPNFLSIMNYSFQTQGLHINGHDGLFDYSRFNMPALDENNLNETIGLNGSSAVDNYGTRYYCTSDGEKIVNNVNGQVDWNCNGNATDTNIQADINKSSSITPLESYNDWGNLIFTGGSISIDGANQGLPLETPAEEITEDENALIISLYKVAIVTSGNVTAPVGDTISHTFTISNLGSNPDTYTITANSEAGWSNLSGVPASLSLAAGASMDISITVDIPASASAGTTENINLSAVSQSNPFIEDNATISTVAIDVTAPLVSSIVRTSLNPISSATSVDFTVTFSESVTGVDTVAPFNDFALTTIGVTSASVASVNGSGATRTVTVNTGSGDGTIRLNVVDNDSITDGAGNSLNGGYTGGETYTITKEYTLTINSVNGTIAKNPNQATYHKGDVVQLTATPNVGWTFANWADGLTGNANPGSVTIQGNTSVTANYTQNTYTLTTTKVGNGTITADKSAPYHYGDVVGLTATADIGWTFTGWSGACTASPCSVTMDGDKSVTATFTQNTYTLATTKVGNGTVTADKSAPYHYGDVVGLTATADVGWTFTGWSGACAASPCSVTMNGDKSVTVTFTQNMYTLAINKVGNGTVTADKSAPYHYGDVVGLTATADTGWTFTGWSGACAASPCSITMDGDKAVTATFTQNTYTLATTKVGNGTVTADKSAPYHYGDVVGLTATADPGWTFTGWSGACTASPCTVTMDGDKSVTATFTLVPQERVTNGGFESKISSGWKVVNFAPTDGRTTAIKKAGKASVKISGTAGKTKTLTQTIILSGSAGDTFTFSFWAKGASIPTAGCRAQVTLYNDLNKPVTTKTVNCKTGTYATFQQKTAAIIATGTYTKVVIKFTYAKASGTVWFDGVSLFR